MMTNESPLKNLVTPESLDGFVADVALSISDEPLKFVDFAAFGSLPAGECFSNCASFANAHGGRAIYGWMLWEMPGVLVQAVHHTIWDGPYGIVDITPKPDGEERIAFVADHRAEYVGASMREMLFAHPANPLAQRFVTRRLIQQLWWEPIRRPAREDDRAARANHNPVLEEGLQNMFDRLRAGESAL